VVAARVVHEGEFGSRRKIEGCRPVRNSSLISHVIEVWIRGMIDSRRFERYRDVDEKSS